MGNLLKNGQKRGEIIILVWNIMYNGAMLRDAIIQANLSHSQPTFCFLSFEIKVLFPIKSPYLQTAPITKPSSITFSIKHSICGHLYLVLWLEKLKLYHRFWTEWETCITHLPKVQTTSPHPLFFMQDLLDDQNTSTLEEEEVICWLPQMSLFQLWLSPLESESLFTERKPMLRQLERNRGNKRKKKKIESLYKKWVRALLLRPMK